MDFNTNPFIVIWETAQACDLACLHCRALAQPFRAASDLRNRAPLLKGRCGGCQLTDEECGLTPGSRLREPAA